MDVDWDEILLDSEGDVGLADSLDPSAFLDTADPSEPADADFLENDDPSEPAAAHQDEVAAAAAPLPDMALRKRGRPPGTYGSAFLRKHQAAAQEKIQQRADAALPQPGSIEYARACKKRLKTESASSDAAGQVADVQSLLCPSSSMWKYVPDNESPLLGSFVGAALHSLQRQTDAERNSSDTASILSVKADAIMSDRALKAALKREGRSATLDVARCTTLTASACVLGAGLAWGAGLKSIARQIDAGKLKAILLVEKARYDETPLRVRIEDAAAAPSKMSGTESCDHAKVMQIEYSLHLVLQDTATGRRFLFSGRQPTALQTTDRTTAECILRAVDNVRAMVPDLDKAAACFDRHLRVAASLPPTIGIDILTGNTFLLS